MNTGKKRPARKVTVEISEELYRVLVAYDKYLAERRTESEREAFKRLGIPCISPRIMASVLLEEKLRELKF